MQKMSSELAPLDCFFAQRILEKAGAYTEERALFLRQLMHHSRQGHLCWEPESEISLPPSILEEGKTLFPTAPVVRQGKRVYLQRNWVYETYLLQQTKRLRSFQIPSFHDEKLFHQALQQTIDEGKLTPAQGEAIRSAFQSPFSFLCGGPGTGKTYTAGFFVRLLAASLKKEEKKGFKLVLAAPTGKAAAHLHRSLLAQGDLDPDLKIESTTVHRLLHLRPGESRLFSNRKIEADLVLVDEASMLDVPLLAHLLEAIGEPTRIMLMGDPNQLPPVEAGSLFAEMASLFAVPLQITLRTNEAHLQALARGINAGDSSEVERLLQIDHPSLKRLSWAFDETLGAKLFQILSPSLSFDKPDPREAMAQLDRCRILGALRQGPFGIDALNRQIVQEMARRIKPGEWWSIPILVTSNEPRLELFNGSCGVLIGKSKGSLHLREGTAYFPDPQDGPLRSFTALPPFETAFCLSIHKSQGSEFDKVLALFPPGSERFGREAFYTAATRSKKELTLIGNEEVLRKMLSQRSRRTSGFTERWSKDLNILTLSTRLVDAPGSGSAEQQ